jgi:hypothetical protein
MWSNSRSQCENLQEVWRDEQPDPRELNRGGRRVHGHPDRLRLLVSGGTRRSRRGNGSA